ncbi:MAG: site-specific DNA-methyltransferase [Phycisphaeraceae bacterium]|nr:site-specific DNA-methyltransferase [Phycisphaeraceae bacterium]
MTSTATQLPENQIVVGDCIASMNAWPAASVDLIFADPPYNIGFSYDQYEDNRSDDDYVNWTGQWLAACARLLKPSGSFYVLIGDEYAAESRMFLKKLESQGLLAFRNWIIWHYTFGQNCKVKFNRSHAHLLYCVGSAALKAKGKLTTNLPFTFNREAIAVPSARQTTYNDSRANPTGKLPDDTWYLRPQEAGDSFFRPEEDTWYLSRLCGTFRERQQWHPCQLPESLLERIVKVSSNEGDVVFDPFAGSGTTMTVARRMGRRWLGCEMSPDYAERATHRVLHGSDPDPDRKVVTRNGHRVGGKIAGRAVEDDTPTMF